MAYLLDTNIVIYARDGIPTVLEKLVRHDGALFLSALSLAELQRGSLDSGPETTSRRLRLEVLLARLPILAFDADAAWEYGRILAQRGWSKSRSLDHMIAAHAIAKRMTLVTNNEADFAGIAGLVVENWVTP